MPHPTRSPVRPLALLLLTLLAGCARCSKEGPGGADPGLTRLLPRGARAVVVVPDVGVLGQKLSLLQRLKLVNFVAGLQGAASAEAYVGAVVRQLGVDPRSRESLEKAGLAPGRGAAVVVLDARRTYSVVAVEDAKAFEATVAGLAGSRLGATERAERTEGGARLVTFARPGGGAPALGVAFVKGYALLGPGPVVAELPRLAALPDAQSLTAEPLLQKGLERLPKERDAWAFLPGGGGLLPPGSSEALTATLHVDAAGVTLRADNLWPSSGTSLAALVAQPGAADLTPLLPADSFLVARFAGDPVGLKYFWPLLAGPQLTRAVRASGFDLEGQLLANLQPGAVAGVALAPNAALGGGLPQLDVRRTNPFRFVHLVALARVKDEARAAETLAALPDVSRRFGATMTPTQVPGARAALLTTYDQGEGAHLALASGGLALAAPEVRLRQAVTALGAAGGGGEAPLAPELRPALTRAPLSVVLDVQRLAQAIRDLPSQAWGIGGFAIKATALRWLEATDDLRAVTLAVDSRDRAVQAELSLRLAPAPAPAP